MKPAAFVLFFVSAIALAQSKISEPDVWQDFTRWLEKQQPDSRPGNLIDSYCESLRKLGVSEEEVHRRMKIVSNFIFTRRKGVEILWDKVYAGKNPMFIQRPNALLMDAIKGRKPGRALDIGMGQGRNSVYLAARGWDVTGFDPSNEAVRIARENAAEAGVKIRAFVARDDEFDYGSNAWDLIVITYVRDLTSADAERFWTALRTGGIVVYENGADPTNSVLKAFLKYQIIRFEDVLTTPDWNPENQIRVQRLVAQKTLT